MCGQKLDPRTAAILAARIILVMFPSLISLVTVSLDFSVQGLCVDSPLPGLPVFFLSVLPLKEKVMQARQNWISTQTYYIDI